MEHHLRDYGPKNPLHREGMYINSASGRSNFLGIGMEWFLPLVSVLLFTVMILNILGTPWNYQIVFIAVGVGWGHFLFGIMHSAMHYKVYWMMKVPLLGAWYLSIRKLHDYHHLQITDEGRMQKNYGICFFWFDRLFRSYSPHPEKFNQKGYSNALDRYKDLIGEIKA